MKTSKVVAFWSPYHGQTGQTLAVASAGSYIGINYNVSSLLMHTHFTRSTLENVFLPSEKDIKSILFDEKGIDAVEKLARTKQLSDRSLTDYTTSLVSGRLEILAGTSKTSSEAFTRITETLPYIIACARKSFDLVLCDVNPGSNSNITGIFLKNSDLVVVCLNQNLEVLKEFFEGHLLHPEIQNKKYIILLGNYHKDSIYTSGYVKRLFKYQNAVYTLGNQLGVIGGLEAVTGDMWMFVWNGSGWFWRHIIRLYKKSGKRKGTVKYCSSLTFRLTYILRYEIVILR